MNSFIRAHSIAVSSEYQPKCKWHTYNIVYLLVMLILMISSYSCWIRHRFISVTFCF